MQFPNVTGSNLQRRKLHLPRDFKGKLNLVFIAFQQWQQNQVDSWIPFAQKLETIYADLYYYELPTIRRLNLFSRTFINEGMRVGIPNRTARERTITLYVDKQHFRDVLGISDEGHIVILLLDEQHNIIWRESGVYTSEKGESLVADIRQIQAG